MEPFAMCSEEEALRRVSTRTLSVFEMSAGCDPHSPEMDPGRVVKEYSRSAAGVLQHAEIRSPQTLTQTLDYLLANIVDVDKSNPDRYPSLGTRHTFLDIYRFISDRARAITKDYKLSGTTNSPHYVRDLERIARFHILAAAEGCEWAGFDSVLNLQRLEDVLMALREAYGEAGGENEGEFFVYRLLLKLGSGGTGLKWLAESGSEVRRHPLFGIGLAAFRSYHSGHYVSLFRLIVSSPPLTRILLALQVQSAKGEIMENIKQSYRGKLPLSSFARILRVSDAIAEAFFTQDQAQLPLLLTGLRRTIVDPVN